MGQCWAEASRAQEQGGQNRSRVHCRLSGGSLQSSRQRLHKGTGTNFALTSQLSPWLHSPHEPCHASAVWNLAHLRAPGGELAIVSSRAFCRCLAFASSAADLLEGTLW